LMLETGDHFRQHHRLGQEGIVPVQRECRFLGRRLSY